MDGCIIISGSTTSNTFSLFDFTEAYNQSAKKETNIETRSNMADIKIEQDSNNPIIVVPPFPLNGRILIQQSEDFVVVEKSSLPALIEALKQLQTP